MWNKQRYCKQLQNHVRIENSAGWTEKLPYSENLRICSWSYDMAGHAKKCGERYCELANKTTQQLYQVSTPCFDDHHFKEEELKSVGEIVTWMLSNCSEMLIFGTNWKTWYSMVSEQTCTIDHKVDQIVWQTIISFDLLHSSYVWIQTVLPCENGAVVSTCACCGKSGHEQSKCRLRKRFAIHFWRNIMHFGSHTFVPISWMCKKQTAVSHSSTESEIISLDTGLRLDGLLALELWDLIVTVFGSVSHVSDRTGRPESDDHKHHKSHNKIDVIKDIDAVPSNVQSARQEALLYVFEDNEAVIKMIIKGRSPTMRHVSRTHRVSLDWLFDRINLDSKIQIKCIDTKNQLADLLTKGNFTRDKWNHLLCFFNISHFSSTMAKNVNTIQEKNESQQNRDQWWALLQGCRRTYHPRLQ